MKILTKVRSAAGGREGRGARLRRAGLHGAALAAAMLGAAVALAWIVPLPARLLAPPSSVVAWRDGRPAHVFLSADEKFRIAVRAAEVDPEYVEALIRLEDKRFRSHLGVDLFGIARAATLNARRGRVVSGGSTLTMQLVRLVEPRPRTVRSKVLEALRAVQLELRLSKDEVLEAWLQFAPFGRNLEGVEAGSLAIFGHRADRLSAAEIATLLAIPQDPTPRFPSPGHADALRRARDRVATRLAAWDALPADPGPASSPREQLAAIARTPVPQRLRALPKALPHAARWLLGVKTSHLTLGPNAPDRARMDAGPPEAPPEGVKTSHLTLGAPPERGSGGPGGPPALAERSTEAGSDTAAAARRARTPNPAPALDARLATTLDAGIQALVESRVTRERESLRLRGIQHAAVVVVEHEGGEVRALLGNPSWDPADPGSQFASFAVPRSPGSALKPFLYALAVDRGAALPEQLVSDVPVQYGSYAPKNYDGAWDGMVPLRDALSRSLNVPFVGLLERVGVEPFLSTLRRLGATTLREDPGFYGLSAIVGGVELSPLEMAGLYATLARGGEHKPLRWLRTARSGPAPDRVLSEGACWLTRRALALRDRPDFPARRALAPLPPSIHWKTGTSTGRRDAWALGSGPRYTVAVWLGNLDNAPSAALVGADAAAPILFDLLEALAPGAASASSASNDPVPPELRPVTVCALSGRAPGDACPERREVLALPDRVPRETCPLHRRALVDRASGLAVTPGCRASPSASPSAAAFAPEPRSFLVWPSNVRRFLRERHRDLPGPPSFAPGCEPPQPERAPAIVHPPPGHVAMLLPGVEPSDQQVPLEAESQSASRLDWFVDGEYLGSAAADERIWWTPRPGTHEILVADQGLASRRSLEVRWRP